MLIETSFNRTLTVGVAVLALLPAALGGGNPSIEPRNRVNAANTSTATSTTDSDRIQGFTEPYADINMAAAEMGTLASVIVREGDVVTTGQLLASLDNAVLRASLDVARAGMLAKGELQSASTQLELKKVEQEKLQQLFERNHASQQELDRITGEVQIAEARLQSVREDLEVRRLEHARIDAQLQQREIRSTIDGVVVEVRKDHGEFVSPSDPVVARIVQLDPLLVVFSVPSSRRSDVREGQQVNMLVGVENAPASGEVEFVAPTTDASSGTIRVKVRLPNQHGKWLSGEKTVLLLDDEPPAPSIEAPKQLAKRSK